MSEEQAENVLTLREAQTLCRAALRLLRNWGLSNDDIQALMGQLPEASRLDFENEQQQPNEDMIVRANLLLSIHRQLRVLFADKVQGYQWVKKPNLTFNGCSALDVMLRSGVEGIVEVKEYLEAAVSR
jgi:hypothetical protein